MEERRSDREAVFVRLLRAEGFLGLDPTNGSLMAALAGSGVFRLGGTVVGTHAFRLYEGELNLRLSLEQTAQTDDLDIASFERLSLALEDAAADGVPAVGATECMVAEVVVCLGLPAHVSAVSLVTLAAAKRISLCLASVPKGLERPIRTS